MTQERLLKLLDNPELLSTISYEELKTIALAYPYAHNLRYLLALKARQDQHPEAERMLTTAATYSLDRKQLFFLSAPRQLVPQAVSVAFEESVLELKPIQSVKKELEALTPPAAPAKAPKEASAPPPLPAVEPQTPEEAPRQEEKNEPVVEKPNRMPEMPFAVWFGRFQPPALTDPPEAEEPPQAPQPETGAADTDGLTPQELAERSVAENKDVISETLARLLVKQGYREKAINMYERLGLAFPEKSAYFAAEIEKLKK